MNTKFSRVGLLLLVVTILNITLGIGTSIAMYMLRIQYNIEYTESSDEVDYNKLSSIVEYYENNRLNLKSKYKLEGYAESCVDPRHCINCEDIKYRLRDDILLHSNRPYTMSIRNEFRENIKYYNTASRESNPKRYDDITDLWIVYDSDNYKKVTLENGKTQLLYKGSPIRALASNNDIGTLDKIIQYYRDNQSQFILNAQDGLTLFNRYPDGSESELNLEKSGSSDIQEYFELDASTIRNIASNNATNTASNLELDKDYLRYKFRNEYTADGLVNGNNNIELGLPVASKEVKVYSLENPNNLEKATNTNLKTWIIPIYIDGKLEGFNGNLVDNWLLMDCITILYKDNSESNPIRIFDIDDKYNFSIRNNHRKIYVSDGELTIIDLEKTDTTDLSNKNVVNVKEDIHYEVDKTHFRYLDIPN